MALTADWLKQRPMLIGMLHLPPLPGSPRFGGSMRDVMQRVMADAHALTSGGIELLMLENFGDSPFFPGTVPNVTVAHMTAIAERIKAAFPTTRLGINVLRNDGCAALAIAQAVGADFVRVNVLCGARVTDQGLITGIAHDLLRLRASLNAEQIAILADVDVKHSAPLGPRDIVDEVHDLIERGGADAVIVSGNATGRPVDLTQLARVAAVAGQKPVLIGSGANGATLPQLLKHAAGAIVGTSLKVGGHVDAPVDTVRVRELVTIAQLKNADPSLSLGVSV